MTEEGGAMTGEVDAITIAYPLDSRLRGNDRGGGVEIAALRSQ
jgi:hypothetical protein